MDPDEENEVVKKELFEFENDLKKSHANKRKKEKDDISKEPNPHETPEKEILWATAKGKLDVVKKLLEAQPSLVSVTDSDKYTPLHRACYSNHPEIVDVLLEYGADIHAKTQDLWTPLHSASKWNSLKCVLRLLQCGADVNAQTDGETHCNNHLLIHNMDAGDSSCIELLRLADGFPDFLRLDSFASVPGNWMGFACRSDSTPLGRNSSRGKRSFTFIFKPSSHEH